MNQLLDQLQRDAQTGRVVRQALREVAKGAIADSAIAEALAFNCLADVGTDAQLARLARFLR